VNLAGKAAASYHQAKLIIKLANDVAGRERRSGDAALKIVFLPKLQCEPRRLIIRRQIFPSRFRPLAWRRRAPAI
jgi:glucan phosphorylase